MATCLFKLIREHSIDFIGLQETMTNDYVGSFFRKFYNNKLFVWKWIPSISKSGGIGCGVRSEVLEVCSYKTRKYVLQLNMWDKHEKVKWGLLVDYGVAYEEHKTDFLS